MTDSDAPALLEKLKNLATKSFKDDELVSWEQFARQFLDRFLINEWAGRSLEDIFGAVTSGWEMLKEPGSAEPALRLFNPSTQEDGWRSPHTVLLVHRQDIPFLVASIRCELNRRNIAIHTIKSVPWHVRRDSQHRLTELIPSPAVSGGSAQDSVAEGAQREALIYMEISRHTDGQILQELTESLHDVLNDVATVVADYQPLLRATEEAEHNLALASQLPLSKMVEENQAFLRWLRDNHFTFLGYAEYDLVEHNGVEELHENESKRLGLFRLTSSAADTKVLDAKKPGLTQFYLSPKLITLSKAAIRSRVHRRAYPDYVVVKRFNEQGEVCGEARILGLYTSDVYSVSPQTIPLIREKIQQVFTRSGLDPTSHDGKTLRRIIETFPKDELFQSGNAELYETVTAVAAINERYRVRLFIRPDNFGKFVNCLVYVPRDLFSTRIRRQFQELLGQALHAEEADFNTYLSESILARVHMVFRVDPAAKLSYDTKQLEREIVEITRTWDNHLLRALTKAHGEERASQLFHRYSNSFPAAYRDRFDASTAVQDIEYIATLKNSHDLAMKLDQPADDDGSRLTFRVFRSGAQVELSDAIPMLENLGLRVVSEYPYQLVQSDQSSIWLHKFNLVYELPTRIHVPSVRDSFQQAFEAIWRGKAESDAFNRLVLGARLEWREVMLLRALACYLRQTQFSFTDESIAMALANNTSITRNLVALFKKKFDPRVHRNDGDRESRLERLQNKIIAELDAVPNLNEDRILRRYLTLLQAMLRTNYFQVTDEHTPKDYLSIKFSPQTIPDIPEPRPLYEIFVYSPRMEAVHLRGGRVSRGGLRWSDRLQDYRTEVLGLVKAQQVKNAVILPDGAKGGFVCKKPPTDGGREALQKEAIVCYRMFIRGLLDITDNMDGETIVPPKDVVRLDGDDPYLVVAADKGTASFSDIANELSAEYRYWLGDAFASGGSHGYDHKGMGITARGAWIAVQRHFREKNINVQEQEITVIGIGDMGGDVFGNGMLRSDKIRLIAAFNNLHIFIDPNPDAATSYAERKRLYSAPRGGWSAYNKDLISPGGGVFERTVKSIEITPEMKACLGIDADKLPPNELIKAILQAPVDLLWNGGIGTYVKGSDESHGDVGDKNNDALRVNGVQLRCKVIGEGGNLGMTQKGRVEYCLNGGACNTDFIDNSGGVDCSDHEVNAKILLNKVMVDGVLNESERDQLLKSMTEDVAQLVLDNNYQQTQAISLAQTEALERSAEYRRLMSLWQNQGRLDRELEFLPDDETLVARQAQGKGLTRPELAILTSYSKAILKEDLAQTDIVEDDYVAHFAYNAFPHPLRKRYPTYIDSHPLRRELVATQVANDLVNHMGISFAQRLIDSTGVGVGDMAKAYIIARNTHRLSENWGDLEALDYRIDTKVQLTLMTQLMRRVRRTSRWFLRNRRSHLNPEAEVARFAPKVQELSRHMPKLLRGAALAEWHASNHQFIEAGVPEALVAEISSPGYLYSGLSVVEAAQHLGLELLVTAQMYFDLAELLQLHTVARKIASFQVNTYWDAQARESFLSDLESQLRKLTMILGRSVNADTSVTTVVEQWSQRHRSHVNRWTVMVNEVQSSVGSDFALVSVALRELLDVVQIAQHTEIQHAAG